MDEMSAPIDTDDDANAATALLALINAGWTTQVVRTACELGLAGHIDQGATTVPALASAAGCHPEALARLLRAMVALRLCEEAAGEFRLTAMGRLMRPKVPRSLHHWARHAGGVVWQRLGELPESVRTGTSWPQRHQGVHGYDALRGEAERLFHAAMVELTEHATERLLPVLDLGGARVVVDVGGGSGELLAAILQRWPDARGVLLDQASAIVRAQEVLQARGVAGRCTPVAGDFFAEVPRGGDVYLMKSVLHNWDDENARRILRCCAEAMAPDARLLVIERVRHDEAGTGPDDLATARIDLNMLVSMNGRERGEAAYGALLASAGLCLDHARAAGAEWTILEIRRP
jgi:SAM-dependent methyltransferase